jgi:hypothetical protein
MSEPFEPVTLMDCPSPEATADAPSPVADLVSYSPRVVDQPLMPRLQVFSGGFDMTFAIWRNIAGIFQETNFAQPETNAMSVMCPILPPGGARVDHPTRRQ